jgi:DNA polymerase I
VYLTPNVNYWACDIEGDNLPSSVVWCACAVNLLTREEVELSTPETVADWFNTKKKEGAKFIFHNGIGYDAPTLNRLLGTKLGPSDIIDTMLMSMMWSPSLQGGHSLAAWGSRLNCPKGEFNDFSKLTPEMLTYCMQDARVCAAIYRCILSEVTKAGFTEDSVSLEHRSWALIQKQKENGFAFDIMGAMSLYNLLRTKEKEIEEKIHAIWPPVLQIVRTYKRPHTKDGTPSATYLRHVGQYESISIRPDAGEYDAYSFIAFNIGSPSQRTDKLLELGWRPRASERTPTGQPKPTSKGKLTQSLREFVNKSNHPGPALIASWMELNARANNIKTWIDTYNDNTGCIHGSLWLANTLRYRHSNPNTANIPAVRIGDTGPLKGLEGVYTYEARNLWTVRDRSSRVLVGVDAKGIQLRVLAHYLNNPDFTKAVLDGDPHTYNQEMGGFATRAVAKTFIYAFLLGAGDEKVGHIIGGSSKQGKEIKERFVGNFPGLSQLLSRLDKEVRRTGRIKLCDGASLIVQQPHTRLGYLLQGDENRIMKRAAIITATEIRRLGLDALKVVDVHDEWQYDVKKEHAEALMTVVFPKAFKEAGEYSNYKIPIECDSKKGMTWAETH